MILAELVLSLALVAGLALSASLAAVGTGKTRMLAGVAAVGIMAVSQQFLLMVAGGVLQILLGLAKRRSKNPALRKSWAVSVALGILIIGIAVYLFYLR